MPVQPGHPQADAHPRGPTLFDFGLDLVLPLGLVAWLLAALVAAPDARARGETPADEPVEVSEDLLPLPVSDAERRGIEIVLAYLEEGPTAVYDALATESPVRNLGRSQALAEIEARMGPPEGSTWTLRTPEESMQRDDRAVFGVEMASSLDDTIRIDFVSQRDSWRVWELRCGVDPRASVGLEDFTDLFGATAPALPASPTAWPHPVLGMLALCALLFLAASTISPWAWRRGTAAFLTFTLLAGGALVGCDGLGLGGEDDAVETEEQAKGDDPPPVSLGLLLPLRRALAGGSAGITPEKLKALVTEAVIGLEEKHPTVTAARAWQVQSLLQEGRLAEVESLLAVLPEKSPMPLVALLRARYAFARADAAGTESRFDELRRLGVGHDRHLMESARAYAFLGLDDALEGQIQRLVYSRSREAWPYYTAAKLAVIDDRMERAEVLFHAAWLRRPIPRRQLFADSLLAHLSTRPRVFELFDFGDPREPAVGPAHGDAGSDPLPLPDDARASILGEHLVVELGSSALELPGAGALAPPSAEVQSASRRMEDDARRAYGDLANLVAEVESRGLADPARRHRASTAAEILVAEGRWDDVLDLTSSIARTPESAPTDLVKARATALLRLERSVEATNLLIRVAKSDLANRRRDPGTFYQLGEMLASLGQYDLALRALDRAQSLAKIDISRRRKAQIQLDKELAEASRTYESEHFRLVYPASTGEVYPRRLSWVLEAEWDRLQRWIPVRRIDEKVDVHLYPLRRFLRAYSSEVLVLGIFDGKLRVPLADLASLHPELVQIVSHELAHAMIDVATDGNSPRWLHEGLASHIEMRQRGVNPIPDLHHAGRDLSFTLIEPILDGFGEAQLVELAYSHATWALHYIEAKHGVRSIHRLLDAFERGHDTQGALRRTLGMTPESFDRAVREWSLEEAPQVWPSKLVKYHRLFDDLIDREDLGMMVVDPSRLETEQAYRAPSQAQMPRKMKAWYRVYSTEVRPVKASLSRAMPLLRGQAEGNVIPACADLERKVRPLIVKGDALASPDPEVARTLSRAYRAFFNVSQACQAQEWKRMRDELQKAVNYLGRANEALKPHGMTP